MRAPSDRAVGFVDVDPTKVCKRDAGALADVKAFQWQSGNARA